MLRYFVAAFVLAQINSSHCNVIGNEVVSDKQLLLAFVVNRHGERTPDADELSLSQEQEKILNLTYIEGLEGLTNAGKRRAYQIGKFLRQRYGYQGLNVLSSLYLQDELSVRSTDKERTKMTALVAMAAVYPPELEQQWDEGIGKVWQPVPYTAVPLDVDFLRFYSNCNHFKTLLAQAKRESVDAELLPYSDLAAKLEAETGQNFTASPTLYETLFDLFKSQISLGLDIPEWAKPIIPRLSEAARLAYRLYMRTDEMKKIGGGVLLHQFLTAASDILAGKPVAQRLRVFSAHDFNIGAFMDVTKVMKEQSLPEYGAIFALELYKSRSGEISVVPVYLNQAGESAPQVYRFAGCNTNYCPFSKFQELTKEFVLPECEFNKICGFKTKL